MNKTKIECPHCETKYSVEWDLEEQDLPPEACHFCGPVIDNDEDDVEWVNKDEDDSWN